MKMMAITLLAMLMVSGLMLAGSTAPSWEAQFVGCSIGLTVFAGSAWALTKVLRR